MFTEFAPRSVAAVALCLLPGVAVLAAPAVPTVEPRVSSAALRLHGQFPKLLHSGAHSANGVLTGSASGSGCPGGTNHMRWYAHAGGSPDAITWGSQEKPFR